MSLSIFTGELVAAPLGLSAIMNIGLITPESPRGYHRTTWFIRHRPFANSLARYFTLWGT